MIFIILKPTRRSKLSKHFQPLIVVIIDFPQKINNNEPEPEAHLFPATADEHVKKGEISLLEHIIIIHHGDERGGC